MDCCTFANLMKGKIFQFVKTWILPISIAVGVLGYLIYVHIPELNFTHHAVNCFVNIANPFLLFCMLLLSFCKIDFREIRPRPWMIYLLLVQIVGCTVFTIPLFLFPDSAYRILLEGGMLMFVCPTACAAVVVSYKLGGKMENVIAYTIVSNIAAAILFPLIIALLSTTSGHIADVTFFSTFLKILCHVFPILILPMFVAEFLRHFMPRVHTYLAANTEAAFYIWALTLVFCMGISTKVLLESNIQPSMLLFLALTILVCFDLQFRLGHKIGLRHSDRVAGGQTLGQKNTSFAIWLAYSFMTPVTALASGIYILYQNCFNSWQIYRKDNRKPYNRK